MSRPADIVARALLALGAILAAATLEACARGRLDETTTDVPISGMSARVDPEPILDGAVDEFGDPIKPTPDVPEARIDVGPTPNDVGVAPRDTGAVDAGGCGTTGRPCCSGTTCSNGLACTSGVCAALSACGAWRQPCCGIAACGPGLTCGSGNCASATACGASGQTCCSGATPCLARQVCSGATCRPCGAAGQACCTSLTPVCNSGFRCAGTSCVPG